MVLYLAPLSISFPTFIRFLLGAFIYMGIEVIIDNTSDPSMGLVGGISFILCGMYDEWFDLHFLLIWAMIAITVTILEYIAGRIWNRDYTIWDYRHLPFNIHGQVCIHFMLIWMLIIAPLILYLDTMFKIIWC